jgi:hypothetical protein
MFGSSRHPFPEQLLKVLLTAHRTSSAITALIFLSLQAFNLKVAFLF